jgi:hypothetical protein
MRGERTFIHALLATAFAAVISSCASEPEKPARPPRPPDEPWHLVPIGKAPRMETALVVESITGTPWPLAMWGGETSEMREPRYLRPRTQGELEEIWFNLHDPPQEARMAGVPIVRIMSARPPRMTR